MTTINKVAVSLALAAASAFGPAVALAAPTGGGSRIAGAGIPALVNPAADLAPHAPGPEPTWNDSIYFTSQVKAGGYRYGILVHTMQFPNSGGGNMSVTVTDKTAGRYKDYMVDIPADEYNWGGTGLNIELPGLSWTGGKRSMSVKATVPFGTLDLRLKKTGPTMKYAGSGAFKLLGATNWEYAFPSMRTTGTLSIDGQSHRVSGETWLDRQWGPINITGPAERWTWMNLALPGGDKLAIWDSVDDGKSDHAWATLLHTDGSHELAPVKPLAHRARRLWTSRASGNAYPTRWRVDIPALDTHLAVRVTGLDAQEVMGSIGARYEATASFAGRYQGKRVTGENYVEMVGGWPA